MTLTSSGESSHSCVSRSSGKPRNVSPSNSQTSDILASHSFTSYHDLLSIHPLLSNAYSQSNDHHEL